MIKVPRGQQTTIKNVIYPNAKKTDNTFHKQNILSIKNKQVENKMKKEAQDRYIPPEPYKIKEFTQIPSKVFNERPRQSQSNNFEVVKKLPRTSTLSKGRSMNYQSEKRSPSQKISSTGRVACDNDENVYSIGQTANQSSFDNYYHNKPIKKTDSNSIHNTSSEKVKVSLKGPTPKANEINLLAPRIQKNHIADNRIKAIENKFPVKTTQVQQDPTIHRNFGKTPEYLLKYKQEAEYKKELEKQIEEQAKYPQGTRLLSEEERLSTLKGLEESRREIMGLLEKLPISMRTLSIQNRKMELENKLDEIEKAMRTFSRTKVFVKIDQ